MTGDEARAAVEFLKVDVALLSKSPMVPASVKCAAIRITDLIAYLMEEKENATRQHRNG